MTDAFRQELQQLPHYLGSHLTLSLVGLFVGVSISLPLAIVVSGRPRWRWPVLTVVGAIQTIPSLALLALMVPVLDAFGFLPAVVALSLYSMLPVVRNTITALNGLDPGVLEAARGLGMAPMQILWRIALPLATPSIIAGVRTSAVWVVGIATLSTPIGQPSLGNYIFSGLQTRRWDVVVLGCAAATGLALVIDALIASVERGLRQHNKRRTFAALMALSMLLSAGLAAPSLAGRAARPADVVKPHDEARHDNRADALVRVRIGAKTFTEQYVLSALLQTQLHAAGYQTELVNSLGSSIAFDALKNNDIHVYVDYTGTIWTNHMRRRETPPAWQVQALVGAFLAETHGVALLCPLGFENAYALALPRKAAQAHKLKSIRDLAKLSHQMSLGSDYEFLTRPEWRALRMAYGLKFRETRSFDASLMYDAVARGEVDVITAFSSDGRIETSDLVVLTDSAQALPPYDAVVLLSPTAANTPRLTRALVPLCRKITVELMRTANTRVDRERNKQSPSSAALWLHEQLEI